MIHRVYAKGETRTSLGSFLRRGHGTPVSALTYAQEVAADAPINYWRFNESSGNAVDSNGAKTLTATGTPTYSQGSLVNGGNSVSGWSSANYFQRTGTDGGIRFASPFTWEFFIRTGANVITSSTLLSVGTTAGSNLFNIRVNNSKFDVQSSTSMVGVQALTTNTVYHCALVVSGGNAAFYVNGTGDTPAALTLYDLTSFGADHMAVGVGQAGATAPLNASARVAELAFYNKALSSDRISAHYNARNN